MPHKIYTQLSARISIGLFGSLILTSCLGSLAMSHGEDQTTLADDSQNDEEVEDFPLALPVIHNDEDGVDFVDRCGDTYDYKNVENSTLDAYLQPKGFGETFSDTHEPATVLLRWRTKDQLAASRKLRVYNSGSIASVAGKRWCTGTLLDPTAVTDENPLPNSAYVLTAAHCFTNKYVPFRRPGRQFLPATDVAQHMEVVFNYQLAGDSADLRENITKYRITALVEDGFKQTPSVDYAIIRISDDTTESSDLSQRAVTAGLEAAEENPADNTSIAIIQHPGGSPKKVDAGTVSSLNNNLIAYKNIDTRRGSSGSGVLNKAGKLVGVHVKGGCEYGVGNRATPIATIKAISDLL